LLLVVVPGKRNAENCLEIVQDVQRRTGERTDLLITSDEHSPYRTAIAATYGTDSVTKCEMPADFAYATVRKVRDRGRVIEVFTTLVFGAFRVLWSLLVRSRVSGTINTSFVERHNGTDRLQNARKARKTLRFSKDWHIHNSMTYFVCYSYNFCWPVRTLRVRGPDGHWLQRTPAMAAGLTEHKWTLREWLTRPRRLLSSS
jgi:hypothetical protein